MFFLTVMCNKKILIHLIWLCLNHQWKSGHESDDSKVHVERTASLCSNRNGVKGKTKRILLTKMHCSVLSEIMRAGFGGKR